MQRDESMRLILLCTMMTFGLSSAACQREPKGTIVAESQSQTAQPANQPITVAGCLNAGEAADTYVVTAARTTGGSAETATYQLVGERAVNLQDHVGHRVEVSGTVQTQHEIAASAPAQPAPNERATGTTGTPTVQTRTEIDIRRLAVTSLKPLGDKCEM